MIIREAWKGNFGRTKREAKEMYIKNVENYAPHLNISNANTKNETEKEDDVFMNEEEYRREKQVIFAF